jgi:hypothetical protein
MSSSIVISLSRPPLTPAGMQPIGTRELIEHALRNDQRFNANAEAAYRGQRVARGLAEAKRTLPLETPEYEAVRDSLVNPLSMPGGTPYPIRPVHLALPFIEDVKNAQEATEKTVKGVRK